MAGFKEMAYDLMAYEREIPWLLDLIGPICKVLARGMGLQFLSTLRKYITSTL